MTSLGLIWGISSFGAGFRYKRFIPAAEKKNEKQKLFYPQFYFQLLITIILSIIIFFFEPELRDLIGNISFSIYLVPLYLFVMTIWSKSTNFFRYTNRMVYFNFSTVSRPYLFIGLILFLLFLGNKLTINNLLASQIVVMGTITIPLSLKIIREINLKYYFYNLKSLIEDIKLGFPLVLSYLVDFILSGSDRYFIAAFISVTAVGYYNPAYMLGSLIIFFPKVSGVVLPPLISKAVDEGRENEAQTMINYTLKGFFIIAIPFVFGSFVLSKPLLTLFANEEVALNAPLVTPIVALGIFFYGLTVILDNIFFVRMKTKVMFKATAFAGTFNVILNLIFIYYFRNIIVAAITTLISYIIVFFYVKRTAKTLWQINWDYKVIIKSILSSIIMFIILLYLKEVLPISVGFLILLVCIGLFSYLILIILMKLFSSKEINYFKRILFNRNGI